MLFASRKTRCSREDCACNNTGWCTALSVVENEKFCTTFKTKAKAAKEREKTRQRLIDIGRPELLDYVKYKSGNSD